MTVYKFDRNRYITKRIEEELPAVLLIYLWNLIDERRNNKKVPMDYLQIFELRTEKIGNEENLIITLRQEVPLYEEVHSITHFTTVTGRIYVIDDIDHVTMLWAEEY